MAARETVRVFSLQTDDDLLGARITEASHSVPNIWLDLANGATVEVRVMEDADEDDCEPLVRVDISNGPREIQIDMDAHTARTLGAMLCAATLEDVKEENSDPGVFARPMRISTAQ
jgi:hypothetical protein